LEPPAHGPGAVAKGARDLHQLPAAAESGELQSGSGHAAGQRHEDEQSRRRIAADAGWASAHLRSSVPFGRLCPRQSPVSAPEASMTKKLVIIAGALVVAGVLAAAVAPTVIAAATTPIN